MNLLPDKQFINNVPFQTLINYRKKKNSLWITKYKTLLEMWTVQNEETKSVFTFQPIKRLV